MRSVLALLLVGCSSASVVSGDAGGGSDATFDTTPSFDAGDAGCPSGPTELNGAGGYGVPADPKTGACPADYCFECEVLDWPASCPNLLCLKTLPTFQSYPGQCHSLCDAGASDASSD